jgi:hypothetical protein
MSARAASKGEISSNLVKVSVRSNYYAAVVAREGAAARASNYVALKAVSNNWSL